MAGSTGLGALAALAGAGAGRRLAGSAGAGSRLAAWPGSRDHRPGDLGVLRVIERVPAAPVAELLDDQQAAPALVVCAWLHGQRDAGVVVADEDGQLALVEGEDQPDGGKVQAGAGFEGVGHQLPVY
jgi:hypothetical protein